MSKNYQTPQSSPWVWKRGIHEKILRNWVFVEGFNSGHFRECFEAKIVRFGPLESENFSSKPWLKFLSKFHVNLCPYMLESDWKFLWVFLGQFSWAKARKIKPWTYLGCTAILGGISPKLCLCFWFKLCIIFKDFKCVLTVFDVHRNKLIWIFNFRP